MRKKKFTNVYWNLYVSLVNSNAMRIGEVAKEIGISYSSAYSHLRKNGYEPRINIKRS